MPRSIRILLGIIVLTGTTMYLVRIGLGPYLTNTYGSDWPSVPLPQLVGMVTLALLFYVSVLVVFTPRWLLGYLIRDEGVQWKVIGAAWVVMLLFVVVHVNLRSCHAAPAPTPPPPNDGPSWWHEKKKPHKPCGLSYCPDSSP